ncbi:MAG: lipid-A-disaccharide synthase [Planctomycetota bacterium]|jgi:lipid-A-disaccharide synthase
MPKLLISAGEKSGDQRAAALLRELRAMVPDLEAFGMGGPELSASGCRIAVDASKLDVMGFSEPLKKLPELRAALRTLVKLAVDEKPDAVVVCDYPGFNLRLAARLKEKGIRVVCYVSPQVWAWAPGRARRIARIVDRMLVLFPFEVGIYERVGLTAEFVGHPLADELPGDYPGRADALRAEVGLPDGGRLLALLPGSRPMELQRHLTVFASAAARVRAEIPEVFPVIAAAAGTSAQALADRARAAGFEIPVLAGRTREVLAAAELALVVSGTATLETALLGCPMVVCYRTSWFSYLVGRLLVTIPCIALANVVAGRPTVPELWQTEVTPRRVSEAALALLEDPDALERTRRALSALRGQLGVRGASRRAAEAVRTELEREA